MKKICLFFLPVFLLACSGHNDIAVPDEPEIVAIAGPVTLMADSTHMVLSDYFLHPKSIDSVRLNSSLAFKFSPDSSELLIYPVSRSVPKASAMDFWIKGFRYSLLILKNPKIWHQFIFDPGDKKFKKVYLAGDMNDWNPSDNPMKLKDDKWEINVLVNPGRYQYKFVTDGKWITDPANSEKSGSNSVRHIGTVNPPSAPYLTTVSSEKGKLTLSLKNNADEIFVFWQNYLLDPKFRKIDSNRIEITIPKSAKKSDRSVIRVYAVNNAGLSNEILVPLADGEIVNKPEDLDQSDPHAMVIYFMMIDRFMNGNKENDSPVKDKDVDPKVNYMGGDITGIIKKRDDGYFRDLGVNTLWISPVTQNPYDAWNEYPAPHRKFSGYHGYWPVTLTTVDPRYGTSDELKDLVNDVHKDGMNILLDYVSNHVHKESNIYKQHPGWATPELLPNGKKNLRLWNEQRLTTWFDEFLPTLDLSKPEVSKMMTDSALFWITTYGFDGFRHDAAKHIPEVYWRMLSEKLRDQVTIPSKKNIYQIGETFGSRELIKSYINPGMMNAQFDFSVYFDATGAFGNDNGSLRDLNSSLGESFFYFGNHHVMGNISGNQDLPRFISFASGALKPGEDAVAAGWKRDIEVKDTVGYDKLAMLMAFNMTIPGVPVIYYGDEFGMPGAGDPDNRRMMRFDNLTPHELKMKTITQKLTQLRRNSMPLLYGDFKNIEVNDNTWIYLRSYFGKNVFVLFNRSKTPKDLSFNIPESIDEKTFVNHFGHSFKIDKKKVNITLPGNSFEVFTN